MEAILFPGLSRPGKRSASIGGMWSQIRISNLVLQMPHRGFSSKSSFYFQVINLKFKTVSFVCRDSISHSPRYSRGSPSELTGSCCCSMPTNWTSLMSSMRPWTLSRHTSPRYVLSSTSAIRLIKLFFIKTYLIL